MFTKPITIMIPHTPADADIVESFCENEPDRAHREAAKPKP